MSLLKIEGLTKYFPVKSTFFAKAQQVHAVDGITLEVQAGETLGLVGESGCGKSTLGKTILRLIEPTHGKILFEGEDITQLDDKSMRSKRRQMQIVFQDPFSSLNPRMRVGEIIGEPLLIHKMAEKSQIKSRVLEILKKVGLDESAYDKFPHEFSGGQRQRIGIARALSLQPKLIIADEPVSALDVSIQSQILNLFKEIKREFNLSYIFISHDLSVIKHISDNVAVMYLGRIVEYTDAETLYRDPKHPYTRALISAIPQPKVEEKSSRQVLQGDVPSPMQPPAGCHFHPRCPLAQDRCSKEAPALREVGLHSQFAKKHLVSCHFAS